MHYNFARVHQTLRVTPAMETGISNHVWTLEESAGLFSQVCNVLFNRKMNNLISDEEKIKIAMDLGWGMLVFASAMLVIVNYRQQKTKKAARKERISSNLFVAVSLGLCVSGFFSIHNYPEIAVCLYLGAVISNVFNFMRNYQNPASRIEILVLATSVSAFFAVSIMYLLGRTLNILDKYINP